MNLKTLWEIIKETVQDFSEDKASRLSAALAYYTVFSLAPLLVIVVAIAGLVITESRVQETIIQQVQGLAGQQAADGVDQLLSNFSRPQGSILAIVIGVITLIIGATGVFAQLQDALNTIWEVEPKPGRGIMGMLKDRFLSFTMILGLAFLLMVSLVVSAGLSAVGTFFSTLLPLGEWFWQVVNFVISVGVMTILFALIFQILPDVDIAWGDVWMGALVTSILFNIGKLLLGLYIGNSAVTNAYGAAGSIIVILLWVYYSAQILFLGAEFTQVYARRFGSMIQPAENARSITETQNKKSEKIRRARGEDQLAYQQVQGAVMPITGQPRIYVEEETPREKVRYEPPNPASVVPVIALGFTAALYTLNRIVRKIVD